MEKYKEIIREKDASLAEARSAMLQKDREVSIMLHKVTNHIVAVFQLMSQVSNNAPRLFLI